MKVYSAIFLLCFTGMVFSIPYECPYADSTWQKHTPSLRQRLLKHPAFAKMDNECFIILLHTYAQNARYPERTTTLFSLLKKYCRVSNTFDQSVLHAFLTVVDTADFSRISDGIAALWKTYNGPLQLQLRVFERKGLYAEADRLYSDFNTLSLIDVYDLLKWARIKSILGDFHGAVAIYCKASSIENSFVNVALNQLKRALADVKSPKTKRTILKQFSSCYQSNPGANLDTLSKWLRAAYAHFNLYREEEKAIVTLDKNPQSKGTRLLAVAGYRFARGLFKEALPPAQKAWKHLSTESHRQKCAIICYQSYAHIGKSDSALAWLDKVNLTQLHGKANAVVLYQNSGFFEKADSTMKMLEASITKDTLVVRQYLFQGSFEKARSYISRCPQKSQWRYNRPDILLWHIRIGVYTGSFPQVSLYLDSLNRVKNSPGWHYTAEILATRLAVQRLRVYPDAFQYWGHLRYALYRNKPRDPVAGFNCERWPKPTQEFLVSTLVGALISHEYFDTAQSVLDLVPELVSPQISYFRGLTSFMLGYGDKAEKLFENIILSNPDDVFAHKARIYLLKLKLSHSM